MPGSFFPLSRARIDKRGDFTKIDDASGSSAAGLSQSPPRKPISGWQPLRWWWWWEIIAVTICIASTAGLVALLKSIDNTPLRQWNLLIQPNSAVASLTTINKVALLVPAASCISQLKWNHFAGASRKLADLQLFDAASRGPWGSLVFLLQVSSPIKALVTVGFSLLTILALGLDTSAQQLLQFPIQETEVNDGSVMMGAATGYSSKSITPGTKSNATYAVCNYTISNPHSGNPKLAAAIYPQQMNLTFRIPSVDLISGNKFFESHFIPGPFEYPSGTEFGEFWALKGPRITNFSTQASFNPPEAEAFFASFWWCSKSFQGVTAEPSGVQYAATSAERLSFLSNTTTTNDTIEDGSTFIYGTNSTGLNYTLDESAFESLPEYFHTLLIAEGSDEFGEIGAPSLLAIGALLYQQDLKNITASMADTLTNILRSRDLDENANITNVTGRAVYDETYIRIDWVWLLLPLGETTLVTFLFILSVVITSKQPLLKDSVLAYLATAVRDDARKTTDLRVSQWTSQQDLDRLAEGMIVKLEPDEHGQFEFSRKNT
ncbi:hypothetical protein FHL15_006044 [Xylaria flabelliformis]|uniref:Uncharacterized protein n=1 Tax=Xylaria flabelliformis TaxID=2512241 RepID=A0A553HYZ4_9PEZI|nr:hypothetical protein FHL15_006044 [Xylaria flabelliformis]